MLTSSLKIYWFESTLTPWRARLPLSEEHRTAIQEYIEAMAGLDGVKEAAQKAAEQNQAEVENEVVKSTNKETKLLMPATVKDDSGNPVSIYVVDGKLVLNTSGGIDPEKSAQTIVIYDPNTGQYRFVDPKDIVEMGQPVSPDAAVQSAIDAIQQRHNGIFDHAEQAARQQKSLPAPKGENGGTPPAASAKVDNQGNPIDDNGKLLTEKVSSVDELTNEDFTAPTRSVQLPELPQKVADVLGTGGKPVIIKKNIFEKNKKRHGDLSPEQSRNILLNALYSPHLYGNNQKASRPYNWILIHNAKKHSSVVLEVNHNKDNVEIVNWHYLDDETLKQKERQAIKEGGRILTLESAAGDTHEDLSAGKDSANVAELQGGEPKQPIQMGSGALGSIPKNEKGEPVYEQAEPATAWQAILEQTEGDTDMAAGVVDSMIADKEAAVKKAEKEKPKHADTIAGKIAAEKERKAAIERAKAELEVWKKIAAAKAGHEKAVAERKAAEAKQQEAEQQTVQGQPTEPKQEEQPKADDEDAAERAIAVETDWNDKIDDYIVEHYPHIDGTRARTPEEQKLYDAEREALKNDKTYKEMIAARDAAIEKTEETKQQEQERHEAAVDQAEQPTKPEKADKPVKAEPTEAKEGKQSTEAEGEKPDGQNDGADSEMPEAGEGEDAGKNPSLGDVISTLYGKGKDFASRIFNMKFFDFAKTPDFMKRLGITGSKFTIRYGVIARHFGKDGSHDFTQSEWEQLPNAIGHPFAITRLADKEKGFRIYTTFKTEKGEYVVVGVDVKNAGRDVEVNAISTLFGRRNGAHLSENEQVVYRSEIITPEQESLLSRPNSDQYPPERESSEGKDNASGADTQEGGGKSAVAVKEKPEEKPTWRPVWSTA